MASETSQNLPDFKWNEKRLQALQLLAEDKLNDDEIGQRVGVDRRTLTAWKQHPAFRAKLGEVVAEIEQRILARGIARRLNRVKALDKRWDKLQQVIEERAASEQMQDVPGGKTGLLVRDVKGVGKGEDFQLVELYAVDTGLLRELREHEKQAAQELGQWTEKQELTGTQKIIVEQESGWYGNRAHELAAEGDASAEGPPASTADHPPSSP